MSRRVSCLWLACLVVLTPSPSLGAENGGMVALGSDWPQWGGSASKNMVSPENHLPETFVPGEKKTQGEGIDLATTQNVKWAARIGDFACGTPTVARGKARIRVMLSAAHSREDLDQGLAAFAKVGRELGVLK